MPFSLLFQGGRAQRVEYLLLHTFHAMKYMVPDKFSNYAKETKLMKRRVTHDVEDNNFDVDVNDANYDNDASEADPKKSKKGPSYAGGLVLEPKKGLYDKYILLLDFNSLYPSIIQVDIILLQNILGFSNFQLLSGIVCFICLSTWPLVEFYDSFHCLQLAKLNYRNTIYASLLLRDLWRDHFLVYHLIKILESCQR